jgi:hypothetical protein
MDSQLQQLRDAVKAVAKARAEGRPIDLSALPPEIRSKIQAQLDKLPPEARQQAHAGLAKVEQAASQRMRASSGMHTPVIPKYHGHYNNTVQPGDATRVPVTWIAIVLAIGYGLWKFGVGAS